MTNDEKTCNICDDKFSYDDTKADNENQYMKVCTICINIDVCCYCSFKNRYIYDRNQCSFCKTEFTIAQDKTILLNSINLTKKQFSDCLLKYWDNLCSCTNCNPLKCYVLNSKMGKSLIGICHSVHIFLTLECSAFQVVSPDNLCCQFFAH